MLYTTQQLADLSETSVRTLHHYDEIGLLSPKRNPKNEYRVYDENDLLTLQQILFFRELGFALLDIKKILESKYFDMETALQEHKKMILLKKKRIDELLSTIDKTIKKINTQNNMQDKELYNGFSEKEMEEYKQEAEGRWGHTDAYKQSTERVKKMGKQGLEKAGKEGEEITSQIAECMKSGIAYDDEKVQQLVRKHYEWLENFYEPNLEMYQGLANMYVDDARFKATYEKIAPGLALYMRDAMTTFVKKS